jgi:hypothetical protein
MSDFFIYLLFFWNFSLTLFFLFDKSRIDCLEKQVWTLANYLNNIDNDDKNP